MDLALPAPRSLPLWRPCDYSNRQRSKRHGPRPYRLFGGACVGILGCRRRYAAGLVQRYVAAAATEAQECEVLELVNTDLCEGVSRAEQLEAAHEAEFQPPSELDLVLRAVRYYTECSGLLLSYVPVYVQGYFSGHEGTLETQWQERHKAGATAIRNLINELKGFYVKVGQVIATRSDLFPQEYSRQCASMIDSVNPLPFPVVRKVVEDELLGGLPLEEVFEFFEEEPLGSASIAQVHRAKLQTGREVAVKVQRPNVERRLMSDISVVKTFSMITREIFPVDYYLVCCELEEQLQDEFDFTAEANGMDRIADALCRGGRHPAVHVPRSIPGLTSKRVLCMDFVPGAPLSQLREELKKRGIEIEPGSLAEQVFGRKLLSSLTEAFGIMIFEEGFFHADPHPGNIFIRPDGTISLIDFGQTKQINFKFRKQVAELMTRVAEYNKMLDQDTEDAVQYLQSLGGFAKSMGVEFLPSAGPSCAGALALWLFDSSRRELPDGYEANELSPNCPVRDVASFPREFVLLCRMTLLIRGLAMRLNVGWSLADAWKKPAQKLLDGSLPGCEPRRTSRQICLGRTNFIRNMSC
ncbi:Uncharacterized protein sll0005 [Durusdinium trenchii]|uniref:Uncharacterized protein sll0005 n=2 Tax=Durusdinium trenchii TaxID=1381693 RepID=A0ABP0I3C4_9DINO